MACWPFFFWRKVCVFVVCFLLLDVGLAWPKSRCQPVLCRSFSHPSTSLPKCANPRNFLACPLSHCIQSLSFLKLFCTAARLPCQFLLNELVNSPHLTERTTNLFLLDLARLISARLASCVGLRQKEPLPHRVLLTVQLRTRSDLSRVSRFGS